MSRSSDAFRQVDFHEPANPEVLRVPVTPPLVQNPTNIEAAYEIQRISTLPKPEAHVVVDSDNRNHTIREHFRYMEHQLRKLQQNAGVKRVLVTSSTPREGKTVVASNLAATLASGGARVLLMDVDMRGPGNAALLGLKDPPGLAEVLEGRATISQVLIYLEALNLYYLPSGQPLGDPADLVQGGHLQHIFTQLEEFAWIVVDSPPIGAFADALSMADHADGVILVVRSGMTAKRDLERSLAALKDCRIAGIVLNGHAKAQKDYYSSYNKLRGNRNSRDARK